MKGRGLFLMFFYLPLNNSLSDIALCGMTYVPFLDTCLISTCETLSSRYDGTRKSTMKEHTTYIYQEKAHRK